MTAWIGIDPGQTGGLACVEMDGTLRWAMEMPAVSGEVNAVSLGHVIEHEAKQQPIKVMIEQVHSMPGQGVSSTFKFGKNFGIAIGVVGALHIALHRVTPQKWKKQFTLTGKDKDASRGKATEFWPEMSENWKYKYQNGVSDAALIAEFARRTL
jgi:crossover junction endodeoxyribonuclease RuvC